MSDTINVPPGTMVRLVEEPWSLHAGECVIVTKVDADGRGFDFVIPERRGHAPAKLVDISLGHFDLEKLGIKV
jgi:hypothetical protein